MKLLLCSTAQKVLPRAATLFPKRPQDCKIVCIPTAAKVEDGPKDWLDHELDTFTTLGFTLTMLDLDGATEGDVAAMLENADIIYVTGGNTFFLLEKMRACNFERLLRSALTRGCLYIGSSAGTVVCCPDIDYVRTMDDPSVADLPDTRGLALVDFFVMVHMDHTAFADKANAKLLEMKNGPVPVICLNDDQALFVDGQSLQIV